MNVFVSSRIPYYQYGLRMACALLLFFVSSPVLAQHVTTQELLTYMSLPSDQFDQCMFRKGFVCYKNERTSVGFTCLFAYPGNTLLIRPEAASAVIQYVRTSRSAILLYQVRSKAQCDQLQRELVHLGYTLEPVSADRLTYVRNDVVVTCQRVDPDNGISGNYAGYNLSFVRRWY